MSFNARCRYRGRGYKSLVLMVGVRKRYHALFPSQFVFSSTLEKTYFMANLRYVLEQNQFHKIFLNLNNRKSFVVTWKSNNLITWILQIS